MIDEYEASQRLYLHEGLRLEPYRCTSGKLTIGVGRNLDDNPLTQEEMEVLKTKDVSKGITKAEAFYLLKHDIQRFIKLCQKNIPFFDGLDDERQYALLDLAFNMGIKGLLQFKKMLAYLWIGEYKKAKFELLNSRYAKQVKSRAERIGRLIETGVWKI